MKEILILTGTCGVGKSTIAREWAKKKKGAIVDCDYITEWIFDPEFPHWTKEEERMVAAITSKIVKEYLSRGYSVAIDNVWSPYGLRILKSELGNMFSVELKFVYLRCNRQENQRRDLQRPDDQRMYGRVWELSQELEEYEWPSYVHSLDTSELSIRDTILAISKLNRL